MSEKKSDKLHSIMNDDLQEFIEELFEDASYSTDVKLRVATALQYATERVAGAIDRLREAEE
jgi:hypothetical protein